MVEVQFKPHTRKPGVYVLEDYQQINSENPLRQMFSHPNVWRPPTDVFEIEEAVVVRVEIAGIREIDFSIILDKRTLYIRGLRTDTSERRAYHQIEIRYGEFISEVDLPYPVDIDKIEAIYSNGFLKITLPRAYPRQVRISTRE